MPNFIQHSPFMDAAQIGRGLGQTLGAILFQVPEMRRQARLDEARLGLIQAQTEDIPFQRELKQGEIERRTLIDTNKHLLDLLDAERAARGLEIREEGLNIQREGLGIRREEARNRALGTSITHALQSRGQNIREADIEAQRIGREAELQRRERQDRLQLGLELEKLNADREIVGQPPLSWEQFIQLYSPSTPALPPRTRVIQPSKIGVNPNSSGLLPEFLPIDAGPAPARAGRSSFIQPPRQPLGLPLPSNPLSGELSRSDITPSPARKFLIRHKSGQGDTFLADEEAASDPDFVIIQEVQ